MFSSSTSFPNFMCSLKPNNNNNNNKHKIQQTHFHTYNNLNPTPATDCVIYFGKYKGKMLGSLPSTYLKWVSKNLRAGDFEDWAKLADQVLLDPVYKDRLEWEFVDTILNGNNNNNNNSMSSSLSGNDSAVFKLLEISERFGWDNEDKVGWRRINFELLGTSKGGRIPRLRNRKLVEEEKEERKGGLVEGLSESGGDRRRKERRERRRVREDKLGFLKMDRGSLGNWERERKDDGGDWTVEINKSFPGREGLLRKALNRRRSF